MSAWTNQIRQRWQLIKHDLADIELFGENLYAIHSIEYQYIEDYFYLFAVRQGNNWLSWDEVKFYAALFDFPTVPEIILPANCRISAQDYQSKLISTAAQDSLFGATDVKTGKSCSMEGIVSRNSAGFSVDDFAENIFKYVRQNHVKTDLHWKRNWQRAPLAFERQQQNRGQICGS